MVSAPAADKKQGASMAATATERRRANRKKSFQWQGALKVRPVGQVQDFEASVKDVSDAGLGVEMAAALRIGDSVAITGILSNGLSKTTLQARAAKVMHCREIRAGYYSAGLTYTAEAAGLGADTPGPDYYDILQLSPKADPETIHRVYRLLAQRYHPDNGETGDAGQFKLILEAYRVLNDPEQRAAYDATLVRSRQLRWRIFDQAEASQGREGEKRKRAGILSLLYAQRLNQPQQPALGLHDMEELLGCPREHLEFPLWYLKESGCVTRTDNGRYTITVKGVDRNESDDGAALPSNRLLPGAIGKRP